MLRCSVLPAPLTHFSAVRQTTTAVLDAALNGDKLQAWSVDMSKLDAVVDFVAETCEMNYPGQPLSAIPYHARWRHFEAGKIDRRAAALESGALNDDLEGLRAQLDLVVVSVLLDAGAGSSWKYDEPGVYGGYAVLCVCCC